MAFFSGRRLMLIGLLGMMLGVILPFLMLVRVLPSTFLLNFVAFTCSVGGLMTGIVGITTYAAQQRSRRED